MKLKLTEEQVSYINGLDSKISKADHLINFLIENINVESKIDTIKKLLENNPNDQKLGELVRKIFF